MNEVLNGVVSIATGLSAALVVWGGILALGYVLGRWLGDRGLSVSERFAAAGLAAIVGIALLAPNYARAEDSDRRATEVAEDRIDADAASWLNGAAEGGEVSAQERLGVMLVHGERPYGAALRGDPAEGLEWLERAAGRGSDVARFVLARVHDAPVMLAASR